MSQKFTQPSRVAICYSLVITTKLKRAVANGCTPETVTTAKHVTKILLLHTYNQVLHSNIVSRMKHAFQKRNENTRNAQLILLQAKQCLYYTDYLFS